MKNEKKKIYMHHMIYHSHSSGVEWQNGGWGKKKRKAVWAVAEGRSGGQAGGGNYTAALSFCLTLYVP
jgi:hypothetical protein